MQNEDSWEASTDLKNSVVVKDILQKSDLHCIPYFDSFDVAFGCFTSSQRPSQGADLRSLVAGLAVICEFRLNLLLANMQFAPFELKQYKRILGSICRSQK